METEQRWRHPWRRRVVFDPGLAWLPDDKSLPRSRRTSRPLAVAFGLVSAAVLALFAGPLLYLFERILSDYGARKLAWDEGAWTAAAGLAGVSLVVAVAAVFILDLLLVFQEEIELSRGLVRYECRRLWGRTCWEEPLSAYRGIGVRLYRLHWDMSSRHSSYYAAVVLAHEDGERVVPLKIWVRHYRSGAEEALAEAQPYAERCRLQLGLPEAA